MDKVLIIGGSGFIGSHVADVCSSYGHKVALLDEKKSRWIKDNQEMIEGNILDSKLLNEAMKKASIVFNFAGIADIGDSKDLRIETIESNVVGTAKILESLVSNKIKKYIHASSMYVYSDEGSFYAASKKSAEILVEAYNKAFDFDYISLRYGSLYGPRSQNWNGVRNFIDQIIKKNQVTYSGNGEEEREYINVLDAAKITVDLALKNNSNNSYIITGNQSIKTKDLFSIIFEILGKEKKIFYENNSSLNQHYGHTPYRYSPNKALKIVPSEFTDLGQGLLDLIEEISNEK